MSTFSFFSSLFSFRFAFREMFTWRNLGASASVREIRGGRTVRFDERPKSISPKTCAVPTLSRLPRSPLRRPSTWDRRGSRLLAAILAHGRYRSAGRTFHLGKIVKTLGPRERGCSTVVFCAVKCARGAKNRDAGGARIDNKRKKSMTFWRFTSSLKENWRKRRKEKKGRLHRFGHFVPLFVVFVYNFPCRSIFADSFFTTYGTRRSTVSLACGR